MSNKLKFIITSVWILFSRAYDAYCTHQLTPDLSKEANPLVTILGMTWTPLLLTLGLLTVYTIYVYYLRLFKPRDLNPTEKGYRFGHFIAYTYLGQKGNWASVFYKFPKDLNRFNHWMGLTLPQCVVFAGFVSTAMWFLIHYTDYYKSIHSAKVVYSILIFGCFLICYFWSKKLYNRYLSDSQTFEERP